MELELFENNYQERKLLDNFKPGDLISIKNYSNSSKSYEVDVFELKEINISQTKKLNYFLSTSGIVTYYSSYKKASNNIRLYYKKDWIENSLEYHHCRVFIRNANLSEKLLYTINLLWGKI